MLSTILNIIMFEDCRNQWSMSRPLLGLILLNEEYFGQLRQSLVGSQPVDKQATMSQWFDSLMDGIERNLLTKNRDRWVPVLALLLVLRGLLGGWLFYMDGKCREKSADTQNWWGGRFDGRCSVEQNGKGGGASVGSGFTVQRSYLHPFTEWEPPPLLGMLAMR